MTIARLERTVVDQIAAGEVVERPASVVKELVENSLDAGATRIRVEVEGGGLARIAVHDDGSGIAAEELGLALEAHATSKIRAADDLLAVRSYGFRGEALASISSIAHVTLSSRPRDSESGASIVARGGTVEAARPHARAPGTTIEVRDLFFNTPARRKFLKAESTELAHVTETVVRMALARLDVGFELFTRNRLAFRFTAGESLRERIAAGFGRELASTLLEARLDLPDLRLKGLLAPPEQARARAGLQHLWINGRFVRDRTVQGAVRAAYRDFLAESLAPVWFLFLELDPGDVDCNVHPTKVEVRLRRSADVYRAVVAATERTLRTADLAPRFRSPTIGAVPLRADRPNAATPPASRVDSVVRDSAAPPEAPLRDNSLFSVLSEASVHERAVAATAAVPVSAAPPPPAPSLFTAPIAPKVRGGRFVQVLETYVATACAEGLLIFDQHALHERVLYRHLREQWRAKSIRRQELLHPIPVELPAADVLVVEEACELLESVGVRAAPLGRTSVGISSLPAVASTQDVVGLVSRLVGLLRGERPEGRLDDFADRMLFTMACHRAVRAGDALNEEQIAGLLAEADRIEHSHSCPHGRPTRVVIPLAELENLFKRRGF